MRFASEFSAIASSNTLCRYQVPDDKRGSKAGTDLQASSPCTPKLDQMLSMPHPGRRVPSLVLKTHPQQFHTASALTQTPSQRLPALPS